jgi:hypothetical protein
MLAVVGQLLPLMLAVAFSSVPLMVTVTLLLAPNPFRSSLGFLIGWLLGMFIVTGLLSFGLLALPSSLSSQAELTVGTIEIVIGMGLGAYGVVLLARRSSRRPEAELPRWLRTVETLKPLPAVGLALALNIRPKAILLAAAAGLIIGTGALTAGDTAVVLGIFVVIGGSSVGVPVVLTLANPKMMRHPLEAIERWIVRNGPTVTLIVVFLIAAVVIGDGLTRL